MGVFGNHRLSKVMQRNDGYSKVPSNWLQTSPNFQTFVNNFTSNNFAPPKKKPREDSAQNTALQKKTFNPHDSTKPKLQLPSRSLRIGIVGHVIFISLSLLMFALLVVWVIQQAMPRPGKKKMDFSRPDFFFRCDDSGWMKCDVQCQVVIFFGWDEN